jgi:ATP-binding cassette, subfamily B, bacterial CvaB/MchF/RaxB
VYQPLKNRNRDQIIFTAKQQTHFLESSRGVQSIKLFNRAAERQMGWENMLADQMNAELGVSKLTIIFQFANSVLFNIDRIVIVFFGARLALDNYFTVGMLIAFLGFKEQLTTRSSALVDKYFEFKMLSLHSERLADIILSEPESGVDPTSTAARDSSFEKVDADAPTVELRNVSYRYSDDEAFVLQNINLFIRSGECLAITGTSGSGKTTLLKILLGLLVPTSGQVLVNGISLDQYGLFNFREILGTVMQEDTLFSGSIHDNISFFDPVIGNYAVEIAAKRAVLHEEIKRMPMGYATLIGNIGSGLSGGQKQRLLLARALYKDPRILVLDEATSNLDVGNEQSVNDAITQMRLTRILVAHRPQTIAMAERVIVVENGRILDSAAAQLQSSTA